MAIQLPCKGRCVVSGIKFLLDTNVIIGLLKNTPAALELVQENGLRPRFAAISQITKIELLGFHRITTDEEHEVLMFLKRVKVLPIDTSVEEQAIALRKLRKIKLPDAIVLATAISKNLQLITMDKALLKAFEAVAKA
jgi:predicted nucleic acid-binding protein